MVAQSRRAEGSVVKTSLSSGRLAGEGIMRRGAWGTWYRVDRGR